MVWKAEAPFRCPARRCSEGPLASAFQGQVGPMDEFSAFNSSGTCPPTRNRSRTVVMRVLSIPTERIRGAHGCASFQQSVLEQWDDRLVFLKLSIEPIRPLRHSRKC